MLRKESKNNFKISCHLVIERKSRKVKKKAVNYAVFIIREKKETIIHV